MKAQFCEHHHPFPGSLNDVPFCESEAELRKASAVHFDPPQPFPMKHAFLQRRSPQLCETRQLTGNPFRYENTPVSTVVQDQCVLIVGATPGEEWKRETCGCILGGRSMACEPVILGEANRAAESLPVSHDAHGIFCP